MVEREAKAATPARSDRYYETRKAYDATCIIARYLADALPRLLAIRGEFELALIGGEHLSERNREKVVEEWVQVRRDLRMADEAIEHLTPALTAPIHRKAMAAEAAKRVKK